MNDRHTRLSS